MDDNTILEIEVLRHMISNPYRCTIISRIYVPDSILYSLTVLEPIDLTIFRVACQTAVAC